MREGFGVLSHHFLRTSMEAPPGGVFTPPVAFDAGHLFYGWFESKFRNRQPVEASSAWSTEKRAVLKQAVQAAAEMLKRRDLLVKTASPRDSRPWPQGANLL